MVKVQNKIKVGLDVLQYYTTRDWEFPNNNLQKLRSKLTESDRKTFYTDCRELDWDEYFLTLILGTRKYCVKEDPSTLPRARRTFKKYAKQDSFIYFVKFLSFCSFQTVLFALTGDPNSLRPSVLVLLRLHGEDIRRPQHIHATYITGQTANCAQIVDTYFVTTFPGVCLIIITFVTTINCT